MTDRGDEVSEDEEGVFEVVEAVPPRAHHDDAVGLADGADVQFWLLWMRSNRAGITLFQLQVSQHRSL